MPTDPAALPLLSFAGPVEFEAWLEAHHADAREVWVKFAKKGRGIQSINFDEALELAMCFGWIDSKMHGIDEDFYALRFTPRGPRSNWGERNKRLAQKLVDEGRMRPAGRAAIDTAKADGRWGDPAGSYEGGRSARY